MLKVRSEIGLGLSMTATLIVWQVKEQLPIVTSLNQFWCYKGENWMLKFIKICHTENNGKCTFRRGLSFSTFSEWAYPQTPLQRGLGPSVPSTFMDPHLLHPG